MPSQIPDVNQYKNRKDIIDMVVQQLQKDLDHQFTFQLTGNEGQVYEELMTQLPEQLQELHENSGLDIKQLLYRVDVNENKIRESFANYGHMSEFEILAHLIIERELHKVITRLYFSQKLD